MYSTTSGNRDIQSYFFWCAAVQKALEAFYSEELAEAHLWPEEVGYLGMSKDMIYYRGYARWLTKDAERANEIK